MARRLALVSQVVPEPCNVRINRFARRRRVNGWSLCRQREMLMNECAKIKTGFDLAGLIISENCVRRFVKVQVSEGFAIREYALQLHISKQLAQLFRRRYLRCTGRDLRAGRVGIDGSAVQKNDKSEQSS